MLNNLVGPASILEATCGTMLTSAPPFEHAFQLHDSAFKEIGLISNLQQSTCSHFETCQPNCSKPHHLFFFFCRSTKVRIQPTSFPLTRSTSCLLISKSQPSVRVCSSLSHVKECLHWGLGFPSADQHHLRSPLSHVCHNLSRVQGSIIDISLHVYHTLG